jgi:hypothetical protein
MNEQQLEYLNKYASDRGVDKETVDLVLKKDRLDLIYTCINLLGVNFNLLSEVEDLEQQLKHIISNEKRFK